MKKMTLALILAVSVLLLVSCGENKNQQDTRSGGSVKTTDNIPVILDQAEYLLSQNIFYNDQGSQFVGKTQTKRGVLGKLEDAFNNKTRYYVWGYLDNTLCCDWQWEIVPEDVDSLPPVGSLVKAKGVFTADDKALDGYWLTGVTVETEEKYNGAQADLNMLAMSCTLERVQMFNILGRPESFEGKTAFAYGRVAGVNALEDPYYDSSWQIGYQFDGESPSMGTLIELQGKVADGKITAEKLVKSNR